MDDIELIVGGQKPKEKPQEKPKVSFKVAKKKIMTLEQLEKGAIERALNNHPNAPVRRIAVMLGIPRSTLYDKIRKHGLIITKRRYDEV